MVIEFFAIIFLKAHDGVLKLCVNGSMKSNQSWQNIRLLVKRICPSEIYEIHTSQ
jgi:hypothetical protein